MINLMPPEQKEAIKFGSYNVNIIQYMILIIVAGIALAAVITFGVQIVSSDESKLNESITAKQEQLVTYSEDIELARSLTSKISTVDVLLDNEVHFSVLLQEIGSLLPPGSSLNDLNLSNDTSENIVLTANTDSEAIATQLQQNLVNSELFTGADIQRLTTVTTESDGTVVIVEIVVSYDQEAVEAKL